MRHQIKAPRRRLDPRVPRNESLCNADPMHLRVWIMEVLVLRLSFAVHRVGIPAHAKRMVD